MNSKVRRIYVEKKRGFDVEARNMLVDIKENLNIVDLKNIRILNRYDISGISGDDYEAAKKTILSEPPIDNYYDEDIRVPKGSIAFAVESLPGQYDQRADSAIQSLKILTCKEKIEVRCAKLFILEGCITCEDIKNIKSYVINPVESREASLDKYSTLETSYFIPKDIEILDGFIESDYEKIEEIEANLGLAMSTDDLIFCRDYFKNVEKRNPTITEIRVLDTYWSDHCRHTTFHTNINNIQIEQGPYSEIIEEVYKEFLNSLRELYKDSHKDICLMDMATIGMKEFIKKGLLDDIDMSKEINACSIKAKVDVDGEYEDWLIMFKNETHNHPTEIEPFGGAATCLGGAIRDPLSGRAYVYQAMRVTGSGDPRVKVCDTLEGKLPQSKITKGAALGYSSYGNQIGLSTGFVDEIYHEGYAAKRMEIGAVVGATPAKNVVRKEPSVGDVVILLGGRTGRDGLGGATGSSKEHNVESILKCGAEVQKGNPPQERKIQRLFRKSEVTSLIKRCNDFGAGGVAVAIGEIADGLYIDLDKVPKKYEGLDGTEIAISESQERMAVVVACEDKERFIEFAREENLEATVVANVTQDNRLKMVWRGNIIVDIKREFLDTNGAKQNADAYIKSPEIDKSYFDFKYKNEYDLNEAWIKNLQDLNVCSKRGLVEKFDSTIGGGTVFLPFGGKYQRSPMEAMVCKIPVESGETNTGTIMSYGYNTNLSKWSPFHGGMYSVIEAAAKVVAVGGDYKSIRLSFQEYFERLGNDPRRWGKPVASLLGAYYSQRGLNIPAIGGKDSMSGTFMDKDVPPTLVAFALNVVDVRDVISPEFKKIGSSVVLMKLPKDKLGMPDFESLEKNYTRINSLIKSKHIISAHTIGYGGISEAVSKMSFGNKIGMKFKENVENEKLFAPDLGSLILEVKEESDVGQIFRGTDYEVLGYTTGSKKIEINGYEIDIDDILKHWEEPLEGVFPTKILNDHKNTKNNKVFNISYNKTKTIRPSLSFAKPRVFIPVFPGTNCEYDSARAFEKAGGEVNTFVFRNLNTREIEDSILGMVNGINNSQIIMIPGGFSGGDEPDGSGKFIATVFKNPKIKEALMEFLNVKDGLILGICNGFQALIKTGLLPYGKIVDTDSNSPTLTFNSIGRHNSKMVNVKVVSTLSPWFNNAKLGDVYTIPVSHGEGRFIANKDKMDDLIKNGQIAAQYIDFDGNASMDIDYNPNGSMYGVEAITSPDGRVLGKMGHSERFGSNVAKNILGDKEQKIFEAGINYYK